MASIIKSLGGVMTGFVKSPGIGVVVGSEVIVCSVVVVDSVVVVGISIIIGVPNFWILCPFESTTNKLPF